jgi:hypothetical protein
MSTWWLGHILGVSGLLFSLLDMLAIKDAIEGMPSGFRLCISFFSLVYVLFQSLRAHERWRKDRHENNKAEFLWKLEKQKLLNESKSQK